MEPDSVPRQLREKTEKHYCVKCLREVERDEYLENDFLCDACAAELEKAVTDKKGMRDEG
jgi:hypothetical protein